MRDEKPSKDVHTDCKDAYRDMLCHKRRLHHEIAYNVSEDHQKTQKFKGVPSFAVEFRTVFGDVNQDHVSAVTAYGQDDDDDDVDVKKDEIEKLNRETERRREDRIEKRRRAIENDPTIRISELMLLNEMSRSMLNALYTNGCVRTIRGVHRSIFLNDVIGWLCGDVIDMYGYSSAKREVSSDFSLFRFYYAAQITRISHSYSKTNRYATVKLRKDDTRTYVVLNITEEGMYVLKPDAQGSSFRSNSSVVKVKGTSLRGDFKADLVDLCGRVRVLMRDGNLRAFYPKLLDDFSEASEKGSDSDWEETSEDEDEEETEETSSKADKTIYVKVNEIETVVAHPRFPCDVLCSICQREPCSTFRPYSTRSREIREWRGISTCIRAGREFLIVSSSLYHCFTHSHHCTDNYECRLYHFHVVEYYEMSASP